MFVKAYVYLILAFGILIPQKMWSCNCAFGAKRQAICPRGLENQMIHDVFAGFSTEGFEKAANEGEPDLVNGLQRKPWGFYKGFDGVSYAVYAFKPHPDHIHAVIDEESVRDFKMLRINIPQYCALYARVPVSDDHTSMSHEDKRDTSKKSKDKKSKRLRDQEAEDEGQARDTDDTDKSDNTYMHVGLLVSRASLYRPKPLDPGARKTNALIDLIARRAKGEDTSSMMPDEKQNDTQSKKRKRKEDTDEETSKDDKDQEHLDAQSSEKEESTKRPRDFEGRDDDIHDEDTKTRELDDKDEDERKDTKKDEEKEVNNDREEDDDRRRPRHDTKDDDDDKAVSNALEDDL